MLPADLTTWVVLADDTIAKIYEHHSHKNSFQLHTELKHPQGRDKIHDLVSDQPGHYKAGGAARGSFTQDHNPKDNENTHFILELVHFLDHARTMHQFHELIIVCLPHFYGLLEKHLPDTLKKTIVRHILKDYLHLSERELLDTVFPKENI